VNLARFIPSVLSRAGL